MPSKENAPEAPNAALITRAKGKMQPGGASCLSELFQLLGKPYTMDLLYQFHVTDHPLRFVELQRRLSLSPNTLSERLKDLVEAGFLTRTAYNEIPPRVDYASTQKAKDLRVVFRTLGEWAKCNDLKPIEVTVKSRNTG